MAWATSFPQFIRENSLSIVLFSIFFLTLAGLSITGWQHHNEQLAEHALAQQTYLQFVGSGEFVEAVFENWESEFLQMWALVMLTIYLRQKGSADSKKLRGRESEDTQSRYSIIHAHTWKQRRRAIGMTLYRNSLGLALLTLFLVSFVLHAIGGVAAYNADAAQHNQEQISLVTYVTSSQFWFESFQNWQSEFLAVGTLLVLSVFLRQHGSPESKPIGEPHARTGSGN